MQPRRLLAACGTAAFRRQSRFVRQDAYRTDIHFGSEQFIDELAAATAVRVRRSRPSG